jgi:hypothetical protein
MPILIALGERSEIIERICSANKSGVTSDISKTFLVFCAVIAVIAVHPYMPTEEKVLMSACIPAPALESLPAIDSAIFIDFE